MIRRRLIAVVTVGFTLAGLVQAETTTLRIQDYPGFGNFLVRVANANGLCEKNGIKCTLRTIPQAPLGMQTLLSGDLDVALTGCGNTPLQSESSSSSKTHFSHGAVSSAFGSRFALI
ncbi:hypothetical protein ACSFA0_26380 [Variovorax sp. LT1P1]|uniref:hypothetical protein n=1 Tax=Variovorax sp. LT1P1 TaxID=3443730 RepID=UPI003F471F58